MIRSPTSTPAVPGGLPFDATQIQFTPAGTGAVARSVQSKERETKSITDFYANGVSGAAVDPTGVLDSTLGILAALVDANSNGGDLYAPAGTYLTGEIAWPGNNITLRGAGSGYGYNSAATPRTIFKAKAGTTNIFNLVQSGSVVDRSNNLLCDFLVDGNSIATNGIKCASSNLISRVAVKGCTGAGFRLADFTNSTHLNQCVAFQNSGWGLIAEGSSTTIYSIKECNFSLNTAGGMDIEAGVLCSFKDVVCESNSGNALKIYRPNAMTGAFQGLTFDEIWMEDNTGFSILIDSQTLDAAHAPTAIKFKNCRIAPSVSTRKYVNVNSGTRITFEDCQFTGSTQSDAVTLSSNASLVAFLESTKSGPISVDGITDAQIDAAIATGFRCYVSDKQTKRIVGSGAPAAAFANSWVNSGGTLPTAKYWFDREGNVHLEGSVKNGTVGNDIFVLPVGYRPTSDLAFPVVSNGAFGYLFVAATGGVQSAVGNNASFGLNGISFQTG